MRLENRLFRRLAVDLKISVVRVNQNQAKFWVREYTLSTLKVLKRNCCVEIILEDVKDECIIVFSGNEILSELLRTSRGKK